MSNERLRQMMAEQFEFALSQTPEALANENAKLRELASRMRDHIKSSCVECDELYCSSWDEDNGCCVYDTLAREAGIKVNE